MYLLVAVVLTANGPSGFVWKDTFVTLEQCKTMEAQEAPKVPNLIYSGCLEIPGESA